MSRTPKNNHYHYAEQYSDGHYCRKAKSASQLHLPSRSVFLALLVLLVFGIVTTTFSANISDDSVDNGSIVISVRNAKADRDIAVTGADAELADTGADVDYAPTGAQTYYYIGQGNTSNWSTKCAMTVSADGFYEYYQITSNTTHQFKIGTASNTYAYNYTYVDAGFNGTNVSEIGDYGSDNCYCWKGSTHYIIVYYPNTLINTTNKPKICASTTLPDNARRVKLGTKYNNNDTYYDMTDSSGTWSVATSLTGNREYQYWFKVVYGTGTNDPTEYYKDLNGATMTYSNCTDWEFSKDTTSRPNTKLTTVTTGNYIFNFTFSSLRVSVVYPTYSISTSVSASTNTTSASSSSVAIGSSVTVSATDSDAAYQFVRWDVKGGTVRTGSYSGTGITTSTDNPLTVFPYGTVTSVTLQAVYKVREYPITYNADDPDDPTATAGTINNPATNSVPTDDKKTHNSDYFITSNVFTRTGYTQVGWSTAVNSTATTGSSFYAFGARYTTNAALTLYPVWQLNTPANNSPGQYAAQDPNDPNPSQPKIISTGNMTVGGTVDLALDIADKSLDVTRTYTYTITGPSGSTYSVGTDPSDLTGFMKFTADTPGSYTVYITVTDVSGTNVTNTNNTASEVSNTATISVAPDVPVFTVTAHNVVVDDRDGTTALTAYKILLGDRYYFSAEIDSTYLANHPTSSYTYTWSTNADFAQNHIVGTGTSITFTNTYVPNTNPKEYSVALINYDPSHTYNNDPNDPAYDPDPRTFADESHGLESVILYCRATCNNVSKDSSDKTVYYFIQPLIESFKYEPMQKIFNLSDETVTLAAKYNIANNPNYTTKLFFSNSNYDPWTPALTAQGFIEDFTNAIRSYLYPAGIKYLYIEMKGPNSMNEEITSVSEKIHTTVGTASSGASRVLYFNNNTNLDLKNYLVMCYYIDGSGTLKYQAAQDRSKGDENNEGRNYRVIIPADATDVRFGFLALDIDRVRYYGYPTIDGNGTITGFTSPIYYGYTDQIELSDTDSVITATSASNDTLHSFTCTVS